MTRYIRMNGLPLPLLASAAATLAVILGLGVLTGRKVRAASDFDTGGGKAGPVLTAGAIVGTLVGGSSTIGTAQLAFLHGLSAWWFTLGASFGCILLAVLSRPLRASGSGTIQEIIGREYGGGSGAVTSVLASAGFIINITAQILAADALLEALFGLPPGFRAVSAALLMAVYVVFGGIRGSGVLGIAKMILIYLAAAVAGITALRLSGGFGTFLRELPRERYFDLFSRGIGVDLGAGLSVALGVLSTQTYVQAVLSAGNVASARGGALLSAAVIPPVGFLGILVGYHMRLGFPDLPASQAFPRFLLEYLPPAWAGMFLAALLVAILGTGAGMALGFGRIVVNDIYKRYLDPRADGARQLLASRLTILAVLGLSALLTLGSLGRTILSFGFLSMGLRAAVLLVPMTIALFLPGRMGRVWAVGSSAAGLGAVLVSERLGLPLDPLFPGLAAGAAAAAAGLITFRRSSGDSRLE